MSKKKFSQTKVGKFLLDKPITDCAHTGIMSSLKSLSNTSA
jgi:hypothetical protein